MNGHGWFRLVTILLASGLAVSCHALQGNPDVPFAADTGQQPPECQVKEIKKMGTGTQADWSADNRQIYFAVYIDKTSELFRMNADGSDRRCLTCDIPVKELKGRHKGVPTVDPTGKYVLFFAENENSPHRLHNTPGFGVDNDFWATDLEGRQYWRLTKIPKGSGIQYPKFSFDGKKFLWSEAVVLGNPFREGREFGEWPLKMADFVADPDPRFVNVSVLEPGGKGYYEAHGFSPDGRQMIFTAILEPGRSQYYGEIYTYDLRERRLTNLARADKLHFEQAVYAPGGRRISFMSGPFIGLVRFGFKTDLYLMDADGTNRARITHFNDPGHPHYLGAAALMNKHSWSKDGTRLVGSYYVNARDELTMFILSFQGACGAV